MNQIIEKFSVFTSKEFLFLGLATILFLDFLYFLWNFFSTRSFIKKSSKASAVVAEARMVNDGQKQFQELTLIFRDDNRMEFAPIIENRFKFRQKGERVEVYYVKNDPANVRINDWRAMHVQTFISFFAMVMTIAVGYYLLGHGILTIPKF